jgi:hypothetical protein
MLLKVRQQDPDLRDARRVLDAVGMNHRQAHRAQVEHSHRGLFVRQAVLRAQAGVDAGQLFLQRGVDRRVVIQHVCFHRFLRRSARAGGEENQRRGQRTAAHGATKTVRR